MKRFLFIYYQFLKKNTTTRYENISAPGSPVRRNLSKYIHKAKAIIVICVLATYVLVICASLFLKKNMHEQAGKKENHHCSENDPTNCMIRKCKC